MAENVMKSRQRIKLAMEYGRLDAIKNIKAWFPQIKPVSLKTISNIEDNYDHENSNE